MIQRVKAVVARMGRRGCRPLACVTQLGFLLDFVRFLMTCFFFCLFRIPWSALLNLWVKLLSPAIAGRHVLPPLLQDP